MTAIAVFNSSNKSTLHLIADTTTTIDSVNRKKFSNYKEIFSTGLVTDSQDEIVFENTLKIGIIQPNLAIGIAGNTRAGNDLLSILKSCGPFLKFNDLKTAIVQRAIPSVTPCNGGIEVCGFFIENKKKIKFKCDQQKKFDFSTNPNTIYVCGSGGSLWQSIIDRIISEGQIDPSFEFIQIAQDIYIKEFLGYKRNLNEFSTGGSISGIYSYKNEAKWQPENTILVFVRPDKLKNNFIRLPIVHKTSFCDANLISSSYIENEDGNYIKYFKIYSNSLSKYLNLDKENIPKHLASFESNRLTCIFLPYGFTDRFPSLLIFKKKAENLFLFFDENFENNIPISFRVSPDFLTHLNKMVSYNQDGQFKVTPHNTNSFEVIGLFGFNRRAYYVEFECGKEKRLFFCVEGFFHEEIFDRYPQKPITYFKMKGLFIKKKKIPSNSFVKIIDIPLCYITLIEPANYLKKYQDPAIIPTLFIFPDFPKTHKKYSIDEAKTILIELPPGKNRPTKNISTLGDPRNKLLLLRDNHFRCKIKKIYDFIVYKMKLR